MSSRFFTTRPLPTTERAGSQRSRSRSNRTFVQEAANRQAIQNRDLHTPAGSLPQAAAATHFFLLASRFAELAQRPANSNPAAGSAGKEAYRGCAEIRCAEQLLHNSAIAVSPSSQKWPGEQNHPASESLKWLIPASQKNDSNEAHRLFSLNPDHACRTSNPSKRMQSDTNLIIAELKQ